MRTPITVPVAIRSIWNRLFLLLFFLVTGVHYCLAQEKVITIGVQFRPIFRGEFFNTSSFDITNEPSGIKYSVNPSPGYCAGMVIRKGITGNFSFETGINYVKRVYTLTIQNNSFAGESSFRIINFELPVLGLIYVRISKNLFLNTAAGFSIDFFPSDISTFGTYFSHYSRRISWVLPSLLANVGMEWRTEKYGYFYLGATYHRTFWSIMKTKIEYTGTPSDALETTLSGNYFTIDLRYFFHQAPENEKGQ